LQEGKRGDYFNFVNNELLPYLRGLRDHPGATPKQRVISEIISPIKAVSVDTETNFANVLDRVHALQLAGADTQHQFMLSQVYEGLLLKMGEKNSDGGQFYTPRELIRAMVRALNPRLGETVCDPCCGTGGFLAESAEHMRTRGGDLTTEALDALKHRTFYGREKDNLAYPIALANLMLHGIDQPHLWHGNTLTRQTIYGGLWGDAPERFHVVLTNPPFGGKEGKEAQNPFAFKTRATQVLFVQYVMQILEPGGRCGIVLDEGLLYRTNEEAFVKTKRKLMDECDVWCIVSLPGGAFTGSGAGVKTNLVFFTKGRKTSRIWYYDLSQIKVGKKNPLTLAQFGKFFELLDKRGTPEGETGQSWSVDFAARRQKASDEAAPHRREAEAQREKALNLREQAKAYRKSDQPEQANKLATQIEAAEKAAREAVGKAEAIEDAVYDLKAVNPREKKTTDTRTPAQLLAAIRDKGSEVDSALERLAALLATTESGIA
jgi:type I restriction enzyme M protein